MTFSCWSVKGLTAVTASLVFIITYAWVLSSDETGALVWLSDWACACRDWLVQSHNRTATCVPTRPVVDSLPLRRKPRWLKQPTGLFLRATFRIHNHRSHRRQIYSLEQPRRIPDVFGFVPLLFPCLLVQDYLLEFWGWYEVFVVNHLTDFHIIQTIISVPAITTSGR